MRMLNHHVLTLAVAGLVCGVAAGQETELKSGEVRASHLLEAVVKRLTGDSVGEVEDLIVSADADVRLAVISVGGVLGVGGKTVALPFTQFMVAPDGATLFLTMSEEELEAWPAFDLESVETVSRSAADEPASPLGETTFEANDFAVADASAHTSATPAEAQSAQQAAAAQQAEAARLTDPAQPAELIQQPPASAQLPDAAQPGQFARTEPLSEAERLAQDEQIPEAQQLGQTDALTQSEQLAQAEQLAEESQPAQAERDRAVSKSKAANQPASALIGAQVVDPQNSAVGKVNDVVVTAEPPEVQVIVELSETLGGDSRLVALPLPELTIRQEGADEAQRQVKSVETSLTVAQLDALPQYQNQF